MEDLINIGLNASVNGMYSALTFFSSMTAKNAILKNCIQVHALET